MAKRAWIPRHVCPGCKKQHECSSITDKGNIGDFVLHYVHCPTTSQAYLVALSDGTSFFKLVKPKS